VSDPATLVVTVSPVPLIITMEPASTAVNAGFVVQFTV
jgi:hypothetical protein